MSYRTSSQPAGAGAGRRNYSSVGSTFGSYGARPSSYGSTSGLSTSSPSTTTTSTTYRPSSLAYGSYNSTTNRDSYGGGGMGNTTYSSGPQFDSHGHNINRGTTTSASTSGSSYLPSTTTSAVNSRLYGPTTTATTSYSRPSSRLENNNNDNYRFSSEMHDATKRLMDAAAESSNNSRQYNSALLPPTRSALSSGTSANAIDRNPLQFSSAVYDNNNNQDASPLSNSSAASSPSSAYSQSPYYHERTGAHSHLLNQPLSRRDELSSNASSNSRSHRNASAAASSHRHRRSVEEYASGFGTTSAAYGASVNQSTPTSNRFAPTQAERQALRQQAEDSDEETDGPHISLAMKQNSSSSYSGIHAKSPTASSSSTRQTTQAAHSPQPPVGLRNIGNTCYMNSALQNIIHSSADFFSSLPFATKESASGKSKLTKALLALAKSSNIQDLMTVKSGAATLNHEFHGGRQNDAHEFIREFIHALHIELNRVGKAPYKEMKDIEGESDADAAKRWFAYYRSHDDSIVTDYFGGFMRSTTVCGHCKHRSLSFSPVWDLSLSMKSGANSIPEMINDYMKIQDLSEFHCEKCKKKRAGKRQSMLVNWPRVLVLQLCRFTYSGARNSQTIDFPARLDQTEIPMSKNGSSLSGGEPVNGYSLAGVVLHKGTANFGHYTAFVKPSGSRTWYNCDDSLVNTVSENEVLRYRTEAYLLFYTMD